MSGRAGLGRQRRHGDRHSSARSRLVFGLLAAVVVATAFAPAALGQPAPRHRAAALTSGTRRAVTRPTPSPSLAVCARALSRHGGPVLYRTPDGELERQLPAACGGGYERRSRTRDVCRDGCFVRGVDRQLAVVGRFREGNLIVVFSQAGRRMTPQLWVPTRASEVQLLDDAGAERIRRSFAAVHGVTAAAPTLQAGEQLAFYVLSWIQEREGWRGELAAAVRSKSALRLAPMATVGAPDRPLKAVSRSSVPAPSASR